MDRILLGDNQFFGVNHMSEEKARTQAMRFQEISAIIEVLDEAYAEGIRTFMCTTHARMAAVCDHFREHRERYPGFTFYPCLPYAHKYANAAAELGMIGAIRSFLPQENALGALLKGGVSIATKDIEGIAALLIEAELKMFQGLHTPIIFLQNVATDFLLGLGFDSAFKIFSDFVRSRYRAEPGFITMNAPMLLPRLEKLGVSNPIICANFNKIGFRMCGGVDAYRQLVESGRCRMIAMSVLASGAIPPHEALEFVCAHPGVKSIVFGASSRRNIAQTRHLIERYSHTAAVIA